MPDYMVRLTHSYETAKTVVGLWAMRCDKILAYEHLGTKTGKVHIHLSLLGTNVDKKQLRNIASGAQLPVSGNEWCSFKIWDRKDEYITYMSKGKYEPKYFTVLTPQEIQSCKDAWINYRHKSKDEVLYTDFVKYIMEREKTLCVTIDDIRSEAIRFAKRKYGVINLGCRRDAAMLKTTYEYEYQKKDKVVLPFD